MADKYVYAFGESFDKTVVGGKGHSLSLMTKHGLPVPGGFTVSCQSCVYFMNNKKWPETLHKEVDDALVVLEKELDKKFGDASNPLLLSVRSGGAVSMPGMMDTVLNLGLNDETVAGMAKLTNNERFAWDSYRRFIQMFGNVVMGIDGKVFEDILHAIKGKYKCANDTELTTENLKEVVADYRKAVIGLKGADFPQDPKEQLNMGISAVFESWNNPRAVSYRRMESIADDWGTAVNVQAMVFGNMGESSGTGVGFTRNPTTGKKEDFLYGEFLMNAQGEDVVAGIRTPLDIKDMKTMDEDMYNQLAAQYQKLEELYKEMVDLEFTIEKGKLYMLQARVGKRTGKAAVRIAVELVNEGVRSKKEAVLSVDPEKVDEVLHPQLDLELAKKHKNLAKGLPASPGAGVGMIEFTAEAAFDAHKAGAKVVLVRTETSPEDIEGMKAAEGVLTARGGMTSHAAVVARGMGKCCVAGCSALVIDEEAATCTIGGDSYKQGDWISLDGTSGKIYDGAVPTTPAEMDENLVTFLGWCDEFRTLGVRANADNPKDAQKAREFGAAGIGLCRTEHMFFGEERIKAVREMILAADYEGRKTALAKLLPFQKADFAGLFRAMAGLPVIIRLLDPPLHEFLPPHDDEGKTIELAESMGVPLAQLKGKIETLKESNPMLGFRGCRLGVVYPEINEMQVRAVIEAAIEVAKEGAEVIPEIMIPVLAHAAEMKTLKELCHRVAKPIIAASGIELKYMVGVMMELPRACLTADQIAEHAEFFSFGTNDLTQTTLGYSRDDAGKFIHLYVDQKILPKDPFQSLDQVGVGELVKTSYRLGKSVKPDLELGICGEHGGDPSSIEFCHRVGLNYISMSPFRVPVARTAAAQAALRFKYGELTQ